MAKPATATWLNKIAKEKTKLLQTMFEMEPIHVDVKDPRTKEPKPHCQGEDIVYIWDKIYGQDKIMQEIVVETVTGPSTPFKDYVDDINANPAMPYQQIRALVGDGGRWKWPEIWKNLDLLPRRGPAWRHIDDPSNLGKIQNPNPNIVPLNCLVVGGGPVGLRLAIELKLGGHRVTVFEKRREVIDKETGMYESVGFTNRVNRPHINNFCRNDLDRLNGRNFMTPKMCYPVFTNAHTSSIGIDESQMLLLKTALLIGVDFQLGVGYSGAEIDIEDEKIQRPTWMVEYTADAMAQERYGKEESGTQRFDCLFGCDGGQSRVRASQVEWLGEPKTRKYKKMFGIVSNLRKVSRKKLKELGYETGLEPEDRAGRNTGVFFYKASYHNYFIVHPPAEEMEANGIPWKGIFSFNKARGEINEDKEDQKKNLKRFMTKKAKELGIPIDESLANDGFVEAPNDVMGFDFSEFYNCEKSAACFVPPLNWNSEEDGEWEIHCPLVALCGDSVSDPNWLIGVGLQRGWNSALDATFYADNIYNNKTFNGKPPTKDEPITEEIEWSEHMDNMMNLMTSLGNAARESKLSAEMDTGMLEEKGPVVNQIRRALKSLKVEPPVPQYVPPVEPWYRYKQFQLAVNSNYKGRDLFENEHPWATRELAIFDYNNRYVERGDLLKKRVTRPTAAMLTWPKRFECSAFWGMMDLLEIDGKPAPGKKPVAKAEPVAAEETQEASKAPPAISSEEVNKIAKFKSERLRESIVLQAMSGPAPSGLDQKDRGGLDSLIFSPSSHKSRYADSFEEAPRPEPTPARAGSPRRVLPQLASEAAKKAVGAAGGGGGLSREDLSAIRDLTETLKACLSKYDAAEKKLQRVIDLYEQAEQKLAN